MSTVILIAMREDEARVRKIVEALLHEKLDVWWERPEAGEGGWARSVETVMAARSVVFFWSAASLGEKGGAYRDLAHRALKADKAISVRLERVKVPDAFHDSTVINLSGWRRNAKDVFLQDLAYTAKAKAVGLDPPPLRGPAKVMFRRLVIVVPMILFAIGLFSTFKGLWATFGMDGLFTQAERRDWAAVHPGSCPDLRTFLTAHPDGAHANRAKSMLNARREWTRVQWSPLQKPLPLYVTRGNAEVRPDEAAARTLVQTRALTQAHGDCQGYAEAGSYRLTTTKVQIRDVQCERLSTGVVCSLEGTSQCILNEPVDVPQESCGMSPGR